jgi:phage baseplate assembly protein V
MADRALLERVLGPLREKILLMITRAVVRRIHDGGGQIQIEGIDGEVSDRVERWGVVGVASHPMPDTEALVVAVGGSRSHLLAICGDDRARRPTDLAEGEIHVYAPDGSNATIKLVDGVITITADQVAVVSPDIELGEGSFEKLLNETALATYNGHSHPGASGPPTALMSVDTDTTSHTKAS